MVDTVIGDAIPGIHDEGLPNIPDGREDWGSAGLRMVLAQAVRSGSYIRSESELTFTNHDGTNDTVDVTDGVAFLEFAGESVDIQSGLGGTSPPPYDTTLPVSPSLPIIIPTTVSGIPLQDGTLSDVWVAYATDATVTNVSSGDIYIRSDNDGGVSAPPHPYVKIGEANPDNASADVLTNRFGRPTFDDVSIADGDSGQSFAIEFDGSAFQVVEEGVGTVLTIPAGSDVADQLESGGAFELNVGGLSGDLADEQDPKPHATEHESGGVDEIGQGALPPQDPTTHASSHAQDAADELLVEDLGSNANTGEYFQADGSGGVISSTAGEIPGGIITIWSGSIANIPSGWVLCDGNNGTPNLQDRFVVGAGNTYAVDDTGGTDAYALSESELASHTHTVPGDTSTGDNATITFDSFGTNSSQTTSATGGDSAHENRPPYYALAYIQKA